MYKNSLTEKKISMNNKIKTTSAVLELGMHFYTGKRNTQHHDIIRKFELCPITNGSNSFAKYTTRLYDSFMSLTVSLITIK